MAPESKPLVPLSASRVKTYDNCSWLYYCNYILKLPQKPNRGALLGSICHSIFELLSFKKHRKHFRIITKNKTVEASPATLRLIKKYIKKFSLSEDITAFPLLDKMILVGLTNEFFIKNGKLVQAEFAFDMVNESPYYRIKGFMDKPVVKGKTIIIDDFKSSKKKFSGEDQESNLQALIYSLAASKLWPKHKIKVRFIFLQFPEDPIMELSFSKNTLKGLEFYLEETQKAINDFNEYDAKQRFAADIEPPANEFKGKLMCGFAKTANEKKKDGSPKWSCPFKFPSEYYEVKDSEGKRLYATFFPPSNLKLGETCGKFKYDGCPRFFSASLNQTPLAQPIKFKNVLDDF